MEFHTSFILFFIFSFIFLEIRFLREKNLFSNFFTIYQISLRVAFMESMTYASEYF